MDSVLVNVATVLQNRHGDVLKDDKNNISAIRVLFSTCG